MALGAGTQNLQLDSLAHHKNAIIAGDLNAHSPLWDNHQPTDTRGEIVEDWFTQHTFLAQMMALQPV